MTVPPLTSALARALLRRPPAPAGVAAFLLGYPGEVAFRHLVAAVFPEPADAAAILGARPTGGHSWADRETARCWAFSHLVEERLFPVYEMSEYAEVLAGVPFIRAGWTDERTHELEDLRRGEWMLLALCLGADGPGGLAWHDALAREAGVRAADLARLPPDGFDRRTLHARLDGTPWAATAEFADWLAGDTGTCFLDFTDELDVLDNDEWDPAYLADLAAQWRLAEGIQARIAALCARLEADPAARFAALVAAALGSQAGERFLDA